MSTASKTKRIYTQDELITRAGIALLSLLGLYLGVMWLGNTWAGITPENLLVDSLTGKSPWTVHHTNVVTLGLVCVLVLGPAAWWADMKLYGPRRRITKAARHMATRWQARGLMEAARRKQIRKKGGRYTLPMIGYFGRTRRKLFFGPEDTALVITGPRQNKSTGAANPMIVEAPGMVLATSNKPDVIYDTMDYREGRVLIYDPQNLYAGDVPEPMFWNPLTYITGASTDRMIERASTLAHRILFAAGAMSGSDKHWGNAAKNIIASMMLAAAVSGRPITEVYRWVLTPNDTEPVQLLQRDGRFPVMAQMLDEYAHHPEETRGGEYSTAQTALSFLAYDTVAPWVTPGAGRKEFRPTELDFTSKTTLCVLSQEGDGSTGPLTAALVIAVYEAANEAAVAAGGRLPVPVMFVLDEVANVARWEALPDLYTHMGSKGILPISMLQNYSQGKHIWGEERMKVFLSVASLFWTGGNVKDNGFHESIVNMVEEHTERNVSESHGKNGRSTSVSNQKKKTLQVPDLRGLPKEYSVLFAANTPTMLLRHHPSYRRRYKKVERQAPVVTAPTFERRTPAPTLASTRARNTGWAVKLHVEEDA